MVVSASDCAGTSRAWPCAEVKTTSTQPTAARRGGDAQRGITPCSGSQLLSTVLVCKIYQQYRLPIQRVYMLRFLNSLFGRVVLALIAGVAIGLLWPDTAVQLKPLGDGFIKLIKMLIPLIVFCVVVHCIPFTAHLY